MSFDPTHPHSLAFLPPSFQGDDPEILKALLRARTHLAELNGYSLAMPDPMLLVSPAIIQESVASSEIEAIHTTVVEVLQGEVFPESERRAPDKEVLRYRDAIYWGYRHLDQFAISTRLICGIHKKLIQEPSGEYRRQQNQIKNMAIGEVIYTPPIAPDLPNLMSNWEKFVNDAEFDWDPLVKCAVAHYQFESIHPFLDGNGRTGRILMILQLVQEKILTYPILYLSGYLNKNRPEYYRQLNSIRTDGGWKNLVLFFLKALEEQAKKTKETLFQIVSMHHQMKAACQKKLPKMYSAELIDHLFSSPVTSPVRLGELLKVHYTTASKYLKALTDEGFLKDKMIGKYHLFVNHKLIKALKD